MATEEPAIRSNCGTRFTIKHILAQCRQYNIKRTTINIPGRLHEILGPKIKATHKITRLLKPKNLYQLIENENYNCK